MIIYLIIYNYNCYYY